MKLFRGFIKCKPIKGGEMRIQDDDFSESRFLNFKQLDQELHLCRDSFLCVCVGGGGGGGYYLRVKVFSDKVILLGGCK